MANSNVCGLRCKLQGRSSGHSLAYLNHPADYDRRFGPATALDLDKDHILRLTCTPMTWPLRPRPRPRPPAFPLGGGRTPPPQRPPRRPLLPPLRPHPAGLRRTPSSSAARTRPFSAATPTGTGSRLHECLGSGRCGGEGGGVDFHTGGSVLEHAFNIFPKKGRPSWAV